MLPTGNVPSSVNPERASSKANTVTLNNIPGGTYKLVVEDEHYCTKETIFVIDEPTRLYYTIAHEDVRSCDADVATGSITVQVTGGTPSYQILLDGGAPVYTTGYYRFSGLIAGNHYVTISDANGCDKFYDVNNGAELQPANSVAAGELSQPPVEVVINKYQPIEIGNLEYVMDDTQDQLGSASFTVRGGNLNNRGEYRINISLSSEDVDGFGARNITLLSSNTTGTTNNTLTTGKYSYVWDENTEQFLVTFSDLEAGTYNISAVDIVTNEATCSTNDGFELSKLALTYTTTDPYCSGIKNGQIAVNVTGAVSVVHYSWEKFNNGGWELISYQTTSTLVGQDAGRYRVTVYDGALDDNIDSDNNHKIGMLQQEFTLAYDRAYQLNENITPVTCYGDNNGAISIVVEGEKSDIPLTYIWSGVAGFASTEQNISNLVAGYYYLQVVDNDGCQVSKSYEVKQPSQISYSISVVDGSVDCENNTRRFQFDAEPIGGERYANGAHYRYTITGPADDQQIGDWEELADVNRVFVNAGTYTMNVEDANGCVAKRTFEVPDAISLINIPPTVGNVSCYNGSDGYISLEVTGVVNPTFQWYSDDPTGKTGAELDAITVRNNTSRSSSLENIPAGTYWVVISRTDASGQDCHRTFGGVQDGFVVAQPQKMTFTATAFDETGCSDEASGKIAVNVVYGTAPYTVMLYGASNDAIVRTTPTGDYTFGELQGSADASGYLYQVQVIDANGCLAVTEADNTKYIQECSVRKPAQLKINNVETGVALGQATKGGFITFDISGGVTGGAANGYSYRVSLTSTSFANIFTVVTDANGNVTDIEPNVAATSVGNKITISGLDAGAYDLTVLDVYSLPSNCTASEQVIVSQLQLIAEYTDPSCSSLNNGTINVSVTGATGADDVEYTWFYNEKDYTVLDADPAHAGAYKSKNNIEETDPSYEDYYAANKMYLSGVVGSYLKEGYYTILATDKSGNEIVAQAIRQIHLVYVKRLSIMPSIVPEQCFGAEDGSISVTVLNNGAPSYEHYTYQWSGADKEVGNDFKVTNLAPGEYFLTITDDEGCSFTSDGLIVDAATQLSFRLDGDMAAVNCGVTGKYNRIIRILDANGEEPKYRNTDEDTYENSTEYLSPLGGTGPYRFSWSGAAPVTKISAGYQYVDNDGNLIEVNGQNVEMDNEGNVEVVLSTGEVVKLHEGDIWNLAKGGTYNVTMTDANGCKLTQSVTIPVEIETENVISTPVSCYGGYYVYGKEVPVKKTNGENVQSEAELAAVLENLGLEANRVIYNSALGYYIYKKDIAVTDKNGNVVRNEDDLATVLTPAGLSLANNDVIPMPGSIDGRLEVVLVEGIETFSYAWFNNKVNANGEDEIDRYEDDGVTEKEALSTKSSVSGLSAGKYWVHVTAGSCQKDLGPYVVSQSIEPLQLVATPTNITSCVNSETGRITVNVTGGTPPYQIYFIDGLENETYESYNGYFLFTGLKAAQGLYRLQVTDAKGCSFPEAGFVEVDVLQPGALSISLDRYQMNTVSDKGEVDFHITGGVEKTDKRGNYYRYYQVVLTGEGTASYKSDVVTSYVFGHNADGSAVEPTEDTPGQANWIKWNDLEPGKYTLTVSDYNSDGYCSISREFEIVDLEIETLEKTNPSCTSNAVDGKIAIAASGNTGTLSYEWYYSPDDVDNMQHVDAYDGRLTLTNLPVGYYKLRVSDAGTSTEGGKVAYFVGTDGKKYYFDIDNAVVDGNNVTAFYYTDNNNNKVYVSYSDLAITTANGVISAVRYIPDNNITIDSEQQNIVYLNYKEETYRLDNSQNIELNTEQWTIKHQSCYGDVYDGAISPVVIALDDSNLSYSWSGPAGFTSNEVNISGLKYGTYYLTVTDERGCSAREGVVVEPAKQIEFELQLGGDQCDVNNRVIKVVHKDADGNYVPGVTGGATTELVKYTFDWAGEVTPKWTEKDAEGNDVFEASEITAGGVYTVYVRDANMCSVSKSTVELHSAVTVDAEVQNVSCYSGHNGRIEPTISGGIGNFEYHWYYSADGSYTLDNLKADLPADQAITTITGYEHTARNATNQVTTRVAAELEAGTYYLVVTDWNSADFATSSTCLHNYYFSWIITQPTELKAVAHDDNQPVYTTCNGYSDATITVDVTGGIAPYSYEWNLGSTTVTTTEPKLSNLSAGTYFVVVTDANGCSAQDYSTVYDAASLNFDFVPQDVDCNGENGVLEIQFEQDPSADPTVNVSWSGKSINTDNSSAMLSANPNILRQENLKSGVYTVRVTRGNNCAVIKKFEFEYPMELIDYAVTNNRCSGSRTGMINITVAGGSGVYGYEWEAYTDAGMTERIENSGVNNGNGAYQAGLMAGYYVVKVYDKNRTNVATGDNASTTYPDHCYIEQGFTVKDATELNIIATDGRETCFGSHDGQISVTVDGGSGNYAYKWYGDGEGLEDDTQKDQYTLGVGHYQVIVTDLNNGCVASQSAQIEGSTTMLETELTDLKNVDCNGANTGSITIKGMGGTPFTGIDDDGNEYSYYRFVWQHETDPREDGLQSTIDNLTAGRYHVTVKDYYGCSIPIDVELTQKEAIETTIVVTDIIKHDEASGAIRITGIIGGVYPYHIKWYKGVADAANNIAGTDDLTYIDNLTAGLYTYVITDGNNCEKEFTAIVSDDGALQVQFEKKLDVLCFGESTGRIEVSIYNGAKPFSISVNGRVETDEYEGGIYVLRNLSAGFYTITVTDSKGATFQDAIEIEEPEHDLLFAVDNYNVQCYGTNNATARITISGGTPFEDENGNKYYEVQRNVQTPEHATETLADGIYYYDYENLRIGNYRFSVTDANGCYHSEYLTLEEHDEVVIDEDSYTNVSCYGEPTGAIEVNISGASTPNYTWTYTGKYDETDMLNEEGNPIGVKYADYIASQNTSKLVELYAGKYTLRVSQDYTDNNGNTLTCESTERIYDITEPVEFLVTPDAYNITTCNGDASGQIKVNLRGGVSPYIVRCYNVLTPKVVDERTVMGTTTTFSDLTAGTYQIVAIDANGCIKNLEPQTLTEPIELILGEVTSDIACEGNGTASFNITGGRVLGGQTRYNVIRRGPVNATTNVVGRADGNGIYTANVVFPFEGADRLPEGTYTITVTDANSTALDKCQKTATFTISNLHVDGEVTQPMCAGISNGSIILNVTGNEGEVSYNWESAIDMKGDLNDPANWQSIGVNATSRNATALDEGIYRVTITDSGRTPECSVTSKNFVLKYQNTITVTAAVTDEQCYGANNGSITNVVVSGIDEDNINYLWMGNNFTATTSTVSDLAPGQYTLTVSDAMTGCELTIPYVVKNAPDKIELNLTDTNNNCDYEHVISIDVKGGTENYRYTINGPSINLTPDKAATPTAGYVETQTLTVENGGTYKVIVHDSSNCSAEEEIQLPIVLSMRETLTHVTCNGGAFGAIDVVVSGGSGDYTYAWTKEDDATFTDNKPNISNLYAGKYTLVVTDNQVNSIDGPCQITATYEIVQPTPITITGSVSDITCFGDANGAIKITAVGGTGALKYSWDNGATTPQISGLGKGNYTVTVMDAMGCTNNETFNVDEPVEISFTLDRVADVDCNGDGGSLKLTDLKGGWKFDENKTVEEQLDLYKIIWAGEACQNGEIGKTELTNLTSHSNGHYVVTVTDASEGRSGCYVTKAFDFTTPLNISVVPHPETCEGQVDGAIDVVVTGGSGAYTYEWTTDDGEGITQGVGSQAGLRAGTYYLTVIDQKKTEDGTDATEHCSIKDVEIVVGRTYTLNIVPQITDVKCAGDNNGSIKLNVSGGSGSYEYFWTGTCSTMVQGAQNQTALTRGQYSVTITDTKFGCEVTKFYEVGGAEFDLEISSINVTDVLCRGNYTGVIEVNVEGGVGPYTYAWSGDMIDIITSQTEGGDNLRPTGTGIASELKAGKYQVVVTDYKGCTVNSGNIEITEPVAKLTASVADKNDVTIHGGADGDITILVTGGSGAYDYSWYKAGYTTTTAPNPVTGVDEITTVFDGWKEYKEGNQILNQSHIDRLEAGDYRVLVVDENGCTVDLDYIHIGEPGEELKANIIKTNITPCNGSANGKIDVDVYGGVVPYTITCTDASGNLVDKVFNASSLNLTGLSAGTYSIDVTDAVGNRYPTQFAKIYEPSPLTLDKNWESPEVGKHPVNVACYNEATGGFTLTVAGGVYPIGAPVDPTDIAVDEATEANYRIYITGPDGYSSDISSYATEADRQFTTSTDVSAERQYTNLKSGIYKITVFVDNNKDGRFDFNTDCFLTDTIEIHQPEAHVELSKVNLKQDFYLCQGESTELKLVVSNWDFTRQPNLKVTIRKDDDTTLEHTFDVDHTPFVFDINQVEFGGYPYETATYRIVNVYEDDADCSRGTFDADIELIEVRKRPTAYIHGDAEVCYGNQVSTTIDLTSQMAEPVWNIVVSDGRTNYTLANVKQSPYIFDYMPIPGNDPLQQTYQIPLTVVSVSDKYCTAVETDVNGNATDDMQGVANITVNKNPMVQMSGSTTICQGENANIRFKVDGGNAPYTITYYYQIDGTDITQTLVNKVPDEKGYITDVVSPKATTVYYLGAIVDSKGCYYTTTDNVTIAVKELPDIPYEITGPDIVCQGVEVTYKAIAVENATGYKWYVPEPNVDANGNSLDDGITIIAGDGSNSVTVRIGSNFKGGEIGVAAANNCSESIQRTKLISVNYLPSKPGDIVVEGNKVQFCQSETGIRMSVPTVDNATTYEWSLPSGFSITYGEGTKNVVLEVSGTMASMPNGVVKVRGVNACGAGEWSEELIVRVNPLPRFTAGNDEQACQETTQLNATLPNGATGCWTRLEGGAEIANIADPKSAVSNLTQGDNIFSWTVTLNGCTASDEVVVRNNKLSVTARAVQTLICDGETELSGSKNPVGTTGLWTIIDNADGTPKGDGIFTDASYYRATIHDLKQGTTTVRWTISQNGCESYDDVVIVNNQPDAPSIQVWAVNPDGTRDAGHTAIVTTEDSQLTRPNDYYRFVICDTQAWIKGSDIADIAGQGQIGTWERVTGGGVFDPDAQDQLLTNLSIGDNVFRYTIKNGSCSRSVTVNLYNAQLRLNAGFDDATCEESYTLRATALSEGQIGHWDYGSITEDDGTVVKSVGTFSNGASNVTTVTNMGRGLQEFIWIVNNEGCISQASVYIANNRVTQATTQAARTVCADDASTILTGNGYNEKYETGEWSIVQGYTEWADKNDPTTVATNFDRGKNVFRWTIKSKEGGCTSYADQIVYNNAIDVQVMADTAVCTTYTTLRAITPTTDGRWTVVAGKGSATIEKGKEYSPVTQVGGLQYGENYFVWTVTKNNCTSSDTVIITNNMPKFNYQYYSVDGKETADIAGADQNLQTAVSTKLQAIPPYSNDYGRGYSAEWDGKDYGIGTWSLVSGGGSFAKDANGNDDIHNPNVAVYGLANGANTFQWRVDNGNCHIEDEVVITGAAVTAAEAGDNVYDLCSDTYRLGANGPYNGIGQWSVIYGSAKFKDEHDPRTIVTGLQQGRNTLQWKIIYNATETTDTIQIWNMSVTPAMAGDDRTICESELSLQGNKPAESTEYKVYKGPAGDTNYETVINSHTWEVISGGAKFQNGENGENGEQLINPTITNLKQGPNTFVYKISNSLNGEEMCVSTDTIVITNDSADKAYACGDGNTCDILRTCDGTYMLNPNVPTYGTGSWHIAGGSGKFKGNIVYDLGNGNNTLVWEIRTDTDNDKCKSTDTVVVRNLQVTIADAGPDDPLPVCGDAGTLSGNKPTYFTEAYWELIDGSGRFIEPGTEENANGPNTYKRIVLYRNENNHVVNAAEDVLYGVENANSLAVKGLSFGYNRFRWVIKNSDDVLTCVSTDETILNNIFIKAEAGGVNPLCTDSVRLNANNPSPGVGRWSIKAGHGRGVFDDPYDPHTYVHDLGRGENILVWTVNYLECPSESEVVVINNSTTPAIISGGQNGQVLCGIDETIVSAGELAISDETYDDRVPGSWDEKGLWSVAQGAGNIISPNSPKTKVENVPFSIDGNVYRWTVTRRYNYNGTMITCFSTDDIVVENNYIETDAGFDDQICSDEYQLKGSSAGVGNGKWTIVGAASAGTFEEDTESTTKITGLARGTNVLRWTVNYKGCESSDDVQIVNGMPSIPYAGQGFPTCSDEVTLTARKPEKDMGVGSWSTVAGQANWNYDDATDKAYYMNPNAVVTIGKGDNTFRWTVTKETEYEVGVDTVGNNITRTLVCSLSDDVVIQNQTPSDAIVPDPFATCSNDVLLKAVTPVYGEGMWTITENGGGRIEEPKSPITMVRDLAYGETTFEWTTSVDGHCAKHATLKVMNFTPTKAVAGPLIEDCASCQNLDANIPVIGEGQWYVLSGSITDEYNNLAFADPFSPKTSVCNLLFGENKFMWQIKNTGSYNGETYECISRDTVTIVNLIPEKANAGDDQIRCKNYTVMNANNPTKGTGKWTLLQGDGSWDDQSDGQTRITNLGYGENIFRWEISYKDCTTSDEVVVYSQQAEPYAGENDVTYSSSYQLNAGNPGRLPGFWTYLGSDTAVVFADSTDYHTMVNGLHQGINTFRWNIKTDDCDVYDEVSIVYKIVPIAGFMVDFPEGCFPLTVRFTDESENATEYNWDFGDGTTSTIRNPTHTFQLPGTYHVVLSVPGPDGLTSDYDMYIRVYDHPIASFDAAPQLVYLPDDKVYFINRSIDAEEFLWSFGDGNTSTEKNPAYQYTTSGLYTVSLKVWNEYGCESDTIKESFIEARRGGFLVFPNTFAPRNEIQGNLSILGVNATFRPVYQDVATFHMEIYNRWGQKLFETDDINEGWDGRFNGDLAPEGMYVYTAKGRFVSGKEYNQAGQVLIVK